MPRKYQKIKKRIFLYKKKCTREGKSSSRYQRLVRKQLIGKNFEMSPNPHLVPFPSLPK
jgi:hypothetical protein